MEKDHAGSQKPMRGGEQPERPQGGSAARDYHPGEVLFEPEGAVYLYAENLSTTETGKIMLNQIANNGAKLTTAKRLESRSICRARPSVNFRS